MPRLVRDGLVALAVLVGYALVAVAVRAYEEVQQDEQRIRRMQRVYAAERARWQAAVR